MAYEPGSKNQHIIYGYLEVGEVLENGCDIPEFAKYHPHANGELSINKTNCMYVAKNKLSINENLPGASFLHFKESLILTKKGMSRSKWELPEFLKNCSITYHTRNSFTEDYFKSAHKGQEFIIKAKENSDTEQQLIKWLKKIIE